MIGTRRNETTWKMFVMGRIGKSRNYYFYDLSGGCGWHRFGPIVQYLLFYDRSFVDDTGDYHASVSHVGFIWTSP